jgi:hypothetical protein
MIGGDAMRLARLARLAATGAAFAVVVGGAVACDPIVNPPPGGGQVIQGSYRIGPFNLAPEGQPGSESNANQGNVPRPPGAFGMKSINFDVVDAAGNPVPHSAVHLHHVLLMNPARTSPFCNNWSERFAGAGSERTPMSLPDPYAYMVGSNERWNALWHLMNTSDAPQQVFIQYTVGYQPGATAQNSRGVTPFFLDVTGCGNSEYDVPGNGGPGSVHTLSRTWSAPWEGYLVTAGGHLHGGGLDIAIRDEADGLECRMVANYDHQHPHDAPGSITRCPIHEHIGTGQQVSVTSRYDNSEPHQDVMGIVLAYAWRGTQ